MQTNEEAVRERTRRPDRSRAEWLTEAKKWRATKKSAEEYAEDHGLNASTLTWWASRLRVGKRASKKKAVPGAEREGRTPRFLPLRVVEHTPTSGAGDARPATEARLAVGPEAAPRPVVTPAAEAQCGIEVVLLNGRRVRFGAGVDETVLARVLKVAEEGGIQC
jgi:hypothetical protein